MKKFDWILILFVLGLAAALWGGWTLLHPASDAPVAIVRQDGETVERLPLDRDARITVGSPEGGYNTVVVEDGAVFVESADCPDKICVRTGKIREVGEVIACLPHRLSVTVESGEG